MKFEKDGSLAAKRASGAPKSIADKRGQLCHPSEIIY